MYDVRKEQKKSKKEIDVEMLRRKLRQQRGQQEEKTQFFKKIRCIDLFTYG